MGKKRRLLHSKKFAVKHDNHPRMKLLNQTQPPEVVENVVEIAMTPTLTAVPTEEAAAKTETATITMPTPPKVKKVTTPRKKTTSRKTKSTPTRKRTTKTKTKSVTT